MKICPNETANPVTRRHSDGIIPLLPDATLMVLLILLPSVPPENEKSQKPATTRVFGTVGMKHGGFEPPTTWLKVRCSTDWASAPCNIGFLGIRNAQSRNRTSDTRIFSPLLYQLSYQGMNCGDRIWTYDLRVMSPTSFQTAPPRDNYANIKLMSGGRWIRTTESTANRFTVCPLWPLGNSPI